jgi:hypothetical protein
LPLFPLPTTTITLNINPLRLSSAVVQKSESGQPRGIGEKSRLSSSHDKPWIAQLSAYGTS